jgi:hypothetical protein
MSRVAMLCFCKKKILKATKHRVFASPRDRRENNEILNSNNGGKFVCT